MIVLVVSVSLAASAPTRAPTRAPTDQTSLEDLVGCARPVGSVDELPYSWLHNFTHSHATNMPESDGPLNTRGQNCLTQAKHDLSPHEDKKDSNTCTSCKTGYGLLLRTFERKIGTCVELANTPRTKCSHLKYKWDMLSLLPKDFFCMKLQMVHQSL